MKLDKLSKKILDSSISIGSTTITHEQLLPLLKPEDRPKALDALCYLEDKLHCVESLQVADAGSFFTYSLTHEGRNYKEMSWIEIRDFLFKSVFTPIMVSIFTTLITLTITMLL